MKKRALAFAVLLLVGAGCVKTEIASFEQCAAAGNPVMESSPRQCRANGKTYYETIPAPPPTTETETATLTVGAPPTWLRGLVLQLKSIDDSRCPKDVQCVWAGELAAVLDVRLDSPAATSLEIRLGQLTKPEAEAFGTGIKLVAIDEASVTVSVGPVGQE